MNDTEIEDIVDDCAMFSRSQMAVIFHTRVAVASLAFISCLVTLLLILGLACHRKILATFVGRMKLYITIVALVLSLVYMLQVLPVTATDELRNSTNGTSVVKLTRIITQSSTWDVVCDTIACLMQYVNWVMLLLIGWMILFLLYYTKNLQVTSKTPLASASATSHSHRAEILGLVFTLTLPFLLTWIPYVTNNYGLDGRWCGITVTSNCGDTSSERFSYSGLVLLLLVWYAPSIVVSLMSTIGLAIIIHRFRAYYEKHGYSGNTYSAIIKGIPPITYLMVYNIISVFNMIETAIFSTTDNPDLRYHFSVAHAVTGPCRALAVPFAFVLSHLVIHRCFKKRRSYISLL